jgi:hypothetical protein
MYRATADKLMQFCANNSTQIAEQWYKALSINTRTQGYHLMQKETCMRHAEFIYKNLEKVYFAEKPEAVLTNLLDIDGFVEDHFARNVPLEQVIYAIILLRRHLWLFAESEALYNGVDELMQMTENLNRVLLVFDYLIYMVASKYRVMAIHTQP